MRRLGPENLWVSMLYDPLVSGEVAASLQIWVCETLTGWRLALSRGSTAETQTGRDGEGSELQPGLGLRASLLRGMCQRSHVETWKPSWTPSTFSGSDMALFTPIFARNL